MNGMILSGDLLIESQRLIALLEQRRTELPFAEDSLALHRPAHESLERSSNHSDAAVEEWRAALARRWECEVAGRRLYKNVLRQLAKHYGGDSAPEVQILSRGGAEINSSPAELLHDLRRLQAALDIGLASFPLASLHSADVDHMCAALEQAIGEAHTSEARRRDAAFDKRLAQEAYRRARATTQRTLLEFYGGSIAGELAELFV